MEAVALLDGAVEARGEPLGGDHEAVTHGETLAL